MTTKITVDAHAGWPVLVTLIDLSEGGTGIGQTETTVAPHTTQDFYITSLRMIRCLELPHDVAVSETSKT
jgi:hypothetical protein